MTSTSLTKEITKNYGVPVAHYLDGAGHFGKVDRDTETQIGRALEQLGSRALIAGSSQAKERIERPWGTLQDRLISELHCYQIKTLDEANEFLKKDFVPRYNAQFSVAPREKDSKFKVAQHADLDMVFCRKVSRKISSAESFSLDGETYVLDEESRYKFRTININTHVDGSQSFDICGRRVRVMRGSENVNKSNLTSIKAA